MMHTPGLSGFFGFRFFYRIFEDAPFQFNALDHLLGQLPVVAPSGLYPLWLIRTCWGEPGRLWRSVSLNPACSNISRYCREV